MHWLKQLTLFPELVLLRLMLQLAHRFGIAERDLQPCL